MQEDKSVVEDFLGDLTEVKEDPFKSEDPFAPSEEVEAQEEEKEEKLPFNKDPKVQRYIQKELDKRLKDFQPTETERFISETQDDEDSLSNVLTRIVGNDTPERIQAVKDLRKELASLEEKGARKAIEQLEARTQAEHEAESQAEAELAEGFENIEETYNVDITSSSAQAKKIRNEFVDFIKMVAPKNADGDVSEYPDLNETFRVFQTMKKAQTQPSRAKELASRSMSRSSDTSAISQPKDQSWKGVERWLNKISS